uniref:Rubicon autophagy regulator n=1 Tax=Dicentrarchus labrax TaxID=13489 RepID=A0A8C4DXF0_DICLA
MPHSFLLSCFPDRRELWKLLSSLKTTVEGLVSTNNPNVWSRYGGLQRLHKDMNNILSHELKNEQVYYKQRDYWPFVWCVRYISPHLASHVEQFSQLEPVLSSGMKSAGESYKAERWLLHSLQVHMLSAQLRPLLRHLGHTRKYYNDDAFLLSEPHVTAMFQCLEAVEQNNPKLLAQVDTVGVGLVNKVVLLNCIYISSIIILLLMFICVITCVFHFLLNNKLNNALIHENITICLYCFCFVYWCHTFFCVFVSSDGSQCSSISDGMFRKPSEGQSLISYLSEQDFGSCADLEKENAHFSISESLIAAIELMKYNLRRQEEEGEEEGDSDCEIQQLKQKIRLRRQQIRRSRLPPCAASQHIFHSTDSGGSRRSSQDSCQGLSDSGSAEEVEEETHISKIILYILSSFFSSPSFLQSNSAESVAMGLLRQFEGMQLPAASELDWLVPEHDAPQKVQHLTHDIYKLSHSSARCLFLPTVLALCPLFNLCCCDFFFPVRRKIVVAKQNYRCAGCGTRIDPDYIKRMRYCEYLGRYFCQCCHENAQAVVPGRVLRKWDFSKYYVSNFARDLLSKIAGDPLFNPNDINSGLYKKFKALETVRVLRVQLFHMKNLFKTCRFAKEVLDQFDSLPGHLTEDLHLFSLNDLTAVRNGDLAPRMKELLKLGTMHVAGCVLCQAKGFVCEFCGNEKDIIFPFQLNKCQRCEECHACYHRGCFRTGKDCPRCQRLAERRERMARKNMEEQEDEGGGT